jgi:hypothetical protein
MQWRMDQRTRYANALSRAERILGSRARLAHFFGVPVDRLASWIDGDEAAPLEIFLASLDLIADGPYAPAARRIRVAVIPQR